MRRKRRQTLEQENRKLKTENKLLQEKVKELTAQIDILRRDLYGRRKKKSRQGASPGKKALLLDIKE